MAYQNAFYDTDDYEVVAAGSAGNEKEPLRNIINDIDCDLYDLIDDIKNHSLAKDEKKLIAAISHIKSNFAKLERKVLKRQ